MSRRTRRRTAGRTAGSASSTTSASCARPIGPSRSTRAGVTDRSTTVDATPPGTGPPSTTAASSSCWVAKAIRTSSAPSVSGSSEMFALGGENRAGRADERQRDRMIRRAECLRLGAVAAARGSARPARSDRRGLAPGRRRSRRARPPARGRRRASGCARSGGRRFRAKRASSRSGRDAATPTPYTVSVGKATTARRRAAGRRRGRALGRPAAAGRSRGSSMPDDPVEPGQVGHHRDRCAPAAPSPRTASTWSTPISRRARRAGGSAAREPRRAGGAGGRARRRHHPARARLEARADPMPLVDLRARHVRQVGDHDVRSGEAVAGGGEQVGQPELDGAGHAVGLQVLGGQLQRLGRDVAGDEPQPADGERDRGSRGPAPARPRREPVATSQATIVGSSRASRAAISAMAASASSSVSGRGISARASVRMRSERHSLNPRM